MKEWWGTLLNPSSKSGEALCYHRAVGTGGAQGLSNERLCIITAHWATKMLWMPPQYLTPSYGPVSNDQKLVGHVPQGPTFGYISVFLCRCLHSPQKFKT